MKTFKELREIDVSKQIEKKGKLSYLSWAWAIDKLLQLDPEASWEYGEFQAFGGSTLMVYCTVHAFSKSRTAQLPVMDYKNKAISEPDAFAVNTAMQRCLAKAIALHGIGLYIYAGEDIPDKEPPFEFTRDHKKFQRDYLYGLSACKTVRDVHTYMDAWIVDLDKNPEQITNCLKDATTSREKGIKDKVQFHPQQYGFVDVKEALNYMKDIGEFIAAEKDHKFLEAYIIDENDKICALDKMLTADKYQTEEGSPKQRVLSLYHNRMNEITPQQEAAE